MKHETNQDRTLGTGDGKVPTGHASLPGMMRSMVSVATLYRTKGTEPGRKGMGQHWDQVSDMAVAWHPERGVNLKPFSR